MLKRESENNPLNRYSGLCRLRKFLYLPNHQSFQYITQRFAAFKIEVRFHNISGVTDLVFGDVFRK